MIKDLIKVANNLDSKGLTKEADLLDKIIYKLAITDVELEGKRDWAARPKTPAGPGATTTNAPAPEGAGTAFQWPWEIWNNLPEKVRQDFYDAISDFESIDVSIPIPTKGPNGLTFTSKVYKMPIPILSQGTAGTKFALQCFEGNWNQAAVTLTFIIIGVILSKSIPSGAISLAKPTASQAAGTAALQLGKQILEGEPLGQLVSLIGSTLSEIAKMLDSKDSLKPLAAQLLAQKSNLKSYIEQELPKYTA